MGVRESLRNSPRMVATTTEGRRMSIEQDTPRLVVPTEVYSRIVGYLRPLQSWAKHKQLEFKDRQTYKVKGVGMTND